MNLHRYLLYIVFILCIQDKNFEDGKFFLMTSKSETKTKLLLLGSTGSIGEQCLDVVRKHSNRFEVVGLTARQNTDLLHKQIQEFQPNHAAVIDDKAADELCSKLNTNHLTFLSGENSLVDIAHECEADVAVIATVGSVGFRPAFAAIESGKNIALANKEVLAMAGDLLMSEARKHHVTVVPIDSEHSAILQCLQCGHENEVTRIILTASGGPFRGKKPDEFENVSVEEALNHPTWSMGAKITIDSATLFNKGLEVIEAHHLFNLPIDQIDVIVHPQSIIHSMVEFIDGSVMAQLGDADMRTPIQYALSYPRRMERSGRKLNLLEIAKMTFFPPDMDSFPCLRMAYDAARTGGTMPAFLSVANEELVYAFLDGKIHFGGIPKFLEICMQKHSVKKEYTLDDIHEVTKEARILAHELIANG